MILEGKIVQMSRLLSTLFGYFVELADIQDKVTDIAYVSTGIIITIAILSCVLGFYSYRTFFSIIMFFFSAATIVYLLGDKELRGTIVTCIAVISTLLAFFSYQWSKVGGFVVCCFVGACIGWIICPSWIAATISAVIAGVIEGLFPVIAISGYSSLFGTWILADVCELTGNKKILMILFVSIAAFVWQMIISRKQKTFSKACPDKIRLFFEKKKGLKV